MIPQGGQECTLDLASFNNLLKEVSDERIGRIVAE